MEMEHNIFEIDTKGICLFCLSNDQCVSTHPSCGKSGNRITIEKGANSFKLLLRYLKIDILKLCNLSTAFLQFMDIPEDMNAVVSICGNCYPVIQKFSELFHQSEQIRLQMDHCVTLLHDAILEGNRSKDKVQEYRQRMRSRKSLELISANIAQKLRMETMRKCSMKMETTLPRAMVDKEAVNQPCPVDSPASTRDFSSVTTLATSSIQNDNELTTDESSLASLDIPEVEVGTGDDFVIKLEPNDIEYVIENEDLEDPLKTDNEMRVQDFQITTDELTANSDQNLRRSTFIIQHVNAHQRSHAARKKRKSLQSRRKQYRAHRCPTCQKDFLTSSNLKRHLITHTGEKPFSCSACGKRYTQRSDWRKHWLSQHPMEAYSKYLPVGITEDQLNIVVQCVVDDQILLSKNKPRTTCPYCSTRVDSKKTSRLRAHLLQRHFEKVVPLLQCQFASNAGWSSVDGDENEENL